LESLIKDAWRLYDTAEAVEYIVQPSVPVLFFGDSERYFQSPLKVITVGLNPSRIEFPSADPFTRFRPAENVHPAILSGHFYAEYLAALNGYFRSVPYSRWFNAFEPILNGMEASYYDGRPNAVLHTDLCSPLATDPTWSKLPPTPTKMALAEEGLRLWLRLVRHLAPDIILISVARHYLGRLDFRHLDNWHPLYTIQRTNPYRVDARRVEVTNGKTALLVFGPASQTPFGKVSTAAKGEIGRRIEERARGR
jgi:hypothetical protein